VNSIGVDLDSRSAILERVSRPVILRMPARQAHCPAIVIDGDVGGLDPQGVSSSNLLDSQHIRD